MTFAIATITLARNKKEEAQLLRSVSLLAKVGPPVFVADRTKTPGFKRKLKSLGLTTLSSSADLVSQARIAVQAAAESATVVAYTEPDKPPFFQKSLPSLITSFRAGTVLIPSRSPASFRTYGQTQQRVETAINLFCSTLFSAKGDYLYGPLIFESGLACLLDSIPVSFGWGWRLGFLKTAADKHVRICLRELDLPCPRGQSKDNFKEWMHRMRQFTQNLNALISAFDARSFRRTAKLFPAFIRDA